MHMSLSKSGTHSCMSQLEPVQLKSVFISEYTGLLLTRFILCIGRLQTHFYQQWNIEMPSTAITIIEVKLKNTNT